MMEELNTALATLIEQATTGIDASVSFLQAELPDVIYQLLLWHGVKSFIFFAIGLSIWCLWGGALLWRRSFVNKERNGADWDNDDIGDFVGISTISGLLVFFVTAIGFLNLTWLQIWIAPKVWLLEYAANLVK
jgi:hypothetical protein